MRWWCWWQLFVPVKPQGSDKPICYLAESFPHLSRVKSMRRTRRVSPPVLLLGSAFPGHCWKREKAIGPFLTTIRFPPTSLRGLPWGCCRPRATAASLPPSSAAGPGRHLRAGRRRGRQPYPAAGPDGWGGGIPARRYGARAEGAAAGPLPTAAFPVPRLHGRQPAVLEGGGTGQGLGGAGAGWAGLPPSEITPRPPETCLC